MDLLLAVGVFFVVALIFPLIRHRLRTGQWAIVVHRAADPFQAYVGWDPLESTCRHASLSIL